jgi:RNA polymerase sigma-70 factor (ECF subfamily)
MNEAELIQSAQRGDLDSFNRLVLVYQDMLFNQAYRMMGEVEVAEDATQDAFIAAYRHINSYHGGSFKAWLLRIITNLCYDELRRRQRRPTTPLEPFDDEDEQIESPAWLADPAESPEEATARRELNRAIYHCLEDLPPEFRSVVVLVDVQGLDYHKTSLAIRKPVGTVKSRLARARQRLRDCLQSIGELLPAGFRLDEESNQ